MSNKQECAFTSVAPYPKVRQLAHGLKDGDYASICRAADMMADGIRGMAAGCDCVLVPIPNHHGRAVYTKTLANEISRRTGIPTWDILSCRPHMPLHYAKKNDLKPEGIYLKLNLYRQVPEQFTPIVIDNVLDTGYTAGAAIKAVGHPNTMLAVLGHTKNHLTNKNFQFNQIPTNMEKKMQERSSDKKQSADSTKKQVKNKTDTPLVVYQRLKSKHPDALILMRNGDFYRSLNEDAQKLSDTLRIPAQKPKFKKDGELIAEFPHHALDVYLPKLIRAGYRVAIADMPAINQKQDKNQNQTDAMEKKTEKKKTKAKEAKVEKTENEAKKTETAKVDKAETKKTEKSVEQSADPRLDGQQLRPQLMKPEDVKAYQERSTTVESLMQIYYPSKLAKKVTPEEYKADNKLSDGRVIDKMVVYKEHDEHRQDVGKYKLYTQVGEQKMSRTMSKEDLNAYFDRVTTPSKLVEKNFGEQLHLASFYNQFKLEEGVKEVRIAKSQQGDWTVSAKLADDRMTSKAVLSWHDKQALFTSKTATKEQLAARYLNTEIKEMSEKVSAKQSFKR